MKCFYHAESDAVGTCLSCHRGVCRECAAESERGIACRGRCEVEVRRLLDLRDFSFAQPKTQESILKRTRQTYVRGGLFNLVLGGGMLIMWYVDRRLSYFGFIGAAMLIFGIATMFLGRRHAATQQFRLCNHCGYNITGNTSHKCPECGHFT